MKTMNEIKFDKNELLELVNNAKLVKETPEEIEKRERANRKMIFNEPVVGDTLKKLSKD